MSSTTTDRIDGLSTSVAVKAPVKAVAVSNITLSGEQTVNGVAVVTGDRVLVTAQNSSVDNGIYDVSASSWTRSADFDGNRDVVKGTLVVSNTGTSIYYRVTSANPIVIGTSAINFEVVAGAITAESVGSIFYPRSAGEVSESVVPTSYAYPVGHASRYGAVGDGVTSDQTALQNALNCAHASGTDCYIPAGQYLVTGLVIPGEDAERGKGLRILGAGTGEAFVTVYGGGTTIRSTTNAPVLQDLLGGTYSSNGTVEIAHIRFEGDSTTPVIKLQSFYGQSSIHHCVILQKGVGDGLYISYGATWHVHDNYVLNDDWDEAVGLGAARTGVGIHCPTTYDNGLPTISKCTSRGWNKGFLLGGGAGTYYSAAIYDSECSLTYTGIHLNGTSNALISGCYLEGGDGGTGILDEGAYSSIRDNLIFPGYVVGIDSSGVTSTKQGTLIDGNVVSLGDANSRVGIHVASDGSYGGFTKVVTGNTIIIDEDPTPPTGCKGIRITGANPRVDVWGNSFDPKEAWLGANSLRISNEATGGGAYGLMTMEAGNVLLPTLSRGILALEPGQAALTASDVASNILTIPNGSLFVVTAGGAATVNRIEGSSDLNGRIVIFRTTTADMTFADTSYINLAGGASFTGPGSLTLYLNVIAGDTYAYEIARSVY